ncbi:MAG: D-alanyl-D-alanine carboxypeptidase [Lachnospiraceae bacterium]|nr:D-alanyl-D-alanine carboxypeptidase [Lachnospiraceae bacterium]
MCSIKKRIFHILLSVVTLFASLSLPVLAEEGSVLTTDVPAPEIVGEAGFLMEANTGTILYAKNENEALYPASITKIMTALVVIENTENFGDVITFSDAAVNGIDWDSTKIYAYVGEQLTVEQALYGLMLKSGNDCAVALAEYVAGSEAAFAEMMNARAAEIGCTNTHFVNAHGLQNENHYTTVHDMALIMREAMENDIFRVIDSTVSYKVDWTNMRESGFDTWVMGNKMMNPNSDSYYEGVFCGKTGYTDQAGNTLVTCATRGNSDLICVVMKCPQSHYNDTKALFDYGFNHFTVYDMASAENPVSYDMGGTNFFGNLESVVGGRSFSIQTGSTCLMLPNSVPLTEIQSRLTYDVGEEGNASMEFARVQYLYQDRVIGETSLTLLPETETGFDFENHENPVPETETQIVQEETKKMVFQPIYLVLGVLGAAAAGLAAFLVIRVSGRKDQYIYPEKRTRKNRLRNASSPFGSLDGKRRRRRY